MTYIGESAFIGNELNTITFLGDMPEGYVSDMIRNSIASDRTIYYNGSSYDALIAEFPDVNRVKQ